MGHDDLKVKGDLSVEGHAKVEHHLEVQGHLNFGDKTASCICTAGAGAVTLNSASGVLSITNLALNTGNFNNLITVTNDKVHASSVILLSFLNPSVNGPLPILGLTAVNEGSFVLAVASGADNNIKVNFLVC